MRPHDLLERLWQDRAVAILRTGDHRIAHDAMSAAVDGGFRLVEFTLGCPRPFDLIEEFAARDGLLVAAGTVLTPADARRAAAAGARIIVSPVFDDEVVATALELGCLAMPGTHTPTEMLRAHRAGALTQKLFPAPASGPLYVRAVLGPLPFLRLVPTNGVSPENVAQWISAGVFAVGFVAPLFPPQVLADHDWVEVERLARESLAAAMAMPRPDRITGPDPFADTGVESTVNA